MKAEVFAETLGLLQKFLLTFLRWPNTVFAHAFADAIERAHKDCKERSFYLLNTRTICAIFSLSLNAVY